jgi:hypothetical protein
MIAEYAIVRERRYPHEVVPALRPGRSESEGTDSTSLYHALASRKDFLTRRELLGFQRIALFSGNQANEFHLLLLRAHPNIGTKASFVR